MPVRPSNLIYDLDDKPALWVTLFLGFQHVCIVAIALIFPVVIIREAGGTTHQAEHMVSICMIAGGIGVIVQALPKGPVGSGYLCPQVCGPSFLSASILAAKTGGLALVFGMTTMATSPTPSSKAWGQSSVGISRPVRIWWNCRLSSP